MTGQMQIVDVVKVPDRSIHKILKMDKFSKGGKDFRVSRNKFWNYIYGAEKQSEHLIAMAVCNLLRVNIQMMVYLEWMNLRIKKKKMKLGIKNLVL